MPGELLGGAFSVAILARVSILLFSPTKQNTYLPKGPYNFEGGEVSFLTTMPNNLPYLYMLMLCKWFYGKIFSLVNIHVCSLLNGVLVGVVDLDLVSLLIKYYTAYYRHTGINVVGEIGLLRKY